VDVAAALQTEASADAPTARAPLIARAVWALGGAAVRAAAAILLVTLTQNTGEHRGEVLRRGLPGTPGRGRSQNWYNPVDHRVTYALCIGVSGYGDPDLPDLRYAHRDAAAVASVLANENVANVHPERLLRTMARPEDGSA
jgi:hypothetical protein